MCKFLEHSWNNQEYSIYRPHRREMMLNHMCKCACARASVCVCTEVGEEPTFLYAQYGIIYDLRVACDGIGGAFRSYQPGMRRIELCRCIANTHARTDEYTYRLCWQDAIRSNLPYMWVWLCRCGCSCFFFLLLLFLFILSYFFSILIYQTDGSNGEVVG